MESITDHPTDAQTASVTSGDSTQAATARQTEHLVGCVPLRAGECLRVDDGGQLLVYVTQGRAWITEERTWDDVFVESGSWFRLQRRGRAIVEALDDAVLLLVSPRATGWASAVSVAPRPAYPRRRTRARTLLAHARATMRALSRLASSLSWSEPRIRYPGA